MRNPYSPVLFTRSALQNHRPLALFLTRYTVTYIPVYPWHFHVCPMVFVADDNKRFCSAIAITHHRFYEAQHHFGSTGCQIFTHAHQPRISSRREQGNFKSLVKETASFHCLHRHFHYRKCFSRCQAGTHKEALIARWDSGSTPMWLTTHRREVTTMFKRIRRIYYEWPKKHPNMPLWLSIIALIASTASLILRGFLAGTT